MRIPAIAGMMLLTTAAHADVAVTALPFTGDKPTRYYLTDNVVVTAGTQGFVVGANNVTLDLNGHMVVCLGEPETWTRAIYAYGRANFTLRNGVIRNCGVGLEGERLSGARVENVRFVDNYFRAIRLDGSDSEILNNRIENTTPEARVAQPEPAQPAPRPRRLQDAGGTGGDGGRPAAAVPGTASLEAPIIAIGIEVLGERNIVHNNTVIDTKGSAESVAISISDRGVGSVVADNLLRNGEDPNDEYGIWVGGESDAEVMGNTIAGFDFGLAASSPTKGFFRNNTVRDARTSYLINGTWTDGGNNY